MLFSASIYSFFSAIRKGELTPLSSIAKAKELGFDAVEACKQSPPDCQSYRTAGDEYIRPEDLEIGMV